MSKVGEMLLEAAKVFDQRYEVYGDNYKRFGAVMMGLFPQGIALETVDDFNRFGIFVQMVSKLTRYAENFDKGGHEDSLVDMSVYTTMLRELDVYELRQYHTKMKDAEAKGSQNGKAR